MNFFPFFVGRKNRIPVRNNLRRKYKTFTERAYAVYAVRRIPAAVPAVTAQNGDFVLSVAKVFRNIVSLILQNITIIVAIRSKIFVADFFAVYIRFVKPERGYVKTGVHGRLCGKFTIESRRFRILGRRGYKRNIPFVVFSSAFEKRLSACVFVFVVYNCNSPEILNSARKIVWQTKRVRAYIARSFGKKDIFKRFVRSNVDSCAFYFSVAFAFDFKRKNGIKCAYPERFEKSVYL